MKEKTFFNLKDMVLMALFAALTCVLAPLAVPIGPGADFADKPRDLF